jgi:MoxR-like ATPase
MNNLQLTTDKLKRILGELDTQLVQRESLLQLTVLAAIAREHLLVLGPPGTAKSAAIRAIADSFGGRYFEYLLGRFTEPNEIFGPVDLRKLRDGIVETNTEGMLPEAHIAFLDEVFLGSSAVLNTLLGILNERKFRRGQTAMNCPLRICVAAANHLPEDESLAAFADRFLVQLHVDSLPESQLESLLAAGWRTRDKVGSAEQMTLEELNSLSLAAREVDLSQVTDSVAQCVRLLRKAKIQLSDRRVVRAQNLIAASTVLNGYTAATEADLWPLVYVVPSVIGQQQAREALRHVLQKSSNAVLPHAVAEASAGRLARADVLVAAMHGALQQALTLLNPESSIEQSAQREGWSLRAEALLREADAGFAADAMPESLAKIRSLLAEHLAALTGAATVAATAAAQPATTPTA